MYLWAAAATSLLQVGDENGGVKAAVCIQIEGILNEASHDFKLKVMSLM
jgi:hypothetical protein